MRVLGKGRGERKGGVKWTILLAVMLLLLTATPGAAQEAGSGAGVITGGYSQEVTDNLSDLPPIPPMPGTCGGEILSLRFVLQQTGTYLGADGDGAAVFLGESTATITSDEDHWFNQEGSFQDDQCLIPAAVDSHMEVDGTDENGNTVHCEGDGIYSRRAVSTNVATMVLGTCTITDEATNNSVVVQNMEHAWEWESFPCDSPLPLPPQPAGACDDQGPPDNEPETWVFAGAYEAAGAST